MMYVEMEVSINVKNSNQVFDVLRRKMSAEMDVEVMK